MTVNTSTLKLALAGLLGIAFLCIFGIIWLTLQEPARQIPDILVGTTTLAVGAIVGILVPTTRP